ncbi:MAG TPA: ABC transporter substrate-binding protein [Tessaracoccus flavescens]|uniref:ABC transporter substrate-binding protein n=1 Tax=Tessaracoccus flavescens TaxID=399497 RepID=A0A921EP10_9ACTN|nr:ABC transporter substrate-binding protein [Tessaracoccus flavescens]
MKRSLALLSVVALGLAACSSNTPAGDESSAGADPNAPVTLRVATFNEFGYEELFTEYMADHPNVKIEHKKAATTDESRDNLNTRLAAGSGLSDIEAVEVDWLPELMQYADKFVDLTNDDVKDRWLEWKTAAATTQDGALIGYGTDIGPEAVCYRADLFEAAGLPSDRAEVAKLLEGDWAKYFEVGKQFVANSDAAWYDSSDATFQGMVNQVAEPFENPDGTPKPLADNTEIKAIYDQIMQAKADGLSAGYAQWSEDWTAAFQNNGFATMLCPGWMMGVIEGNAAGVTGWDVADVFPGGGGNWGGSYLTVPKQSENQEAARELAAWLTAPEQQIKAFKSKGTFPSQVEALESEDLLSQTNEFFNDAPTGEILANRAAAVSVTPYKGPNYFSIRATVTDALNRVESGTDDPASSWDKALEAYQALGLS